MKKLDMNHCDKHDMTILTNDKINLYHPSLHIRRSKHILVPILAIQERDSFGKSS